MEDIAAAAAVGKGTLYRYFKDKEVLYVALLERATAGISARLHRETLAADGVQARLEAVVRAIIGYFDDNPHLFDLIQHAEVMSQPQALSSWHGWREEITSKVREIFEDARRCDAFAVTDPQLVSLLFLGSLRSVIRFGERPRPHDLPRRIIDVFLNGAAIPCKSPRRILQPSRV